MNKIDIWTPDLPFAILAHDKNGVIGFGDHMPYLPREDLRTDNEYLWSVLTNPDQEVSIVGGSNTLLPMLGVIPPAVHDVIVVTRHPERVALSNQTNDKRIRTALDPVAAIEMSLASGRVPAIFGGASIYNSEAVRSRLFYVLSTEIDTAFENTANEPVKRFDRLPTSDWEVKSSQPMPRGAHDKFDARFVVRQRVAAA